jgi:valyl-tRNA synthetase
MAMLEDLQIKELGEKESTTKNCVVALGAGWNAYLYVGDHVDLKKEKERLETELKRVSAIVEGLQKKVSNESFMERAPKDIVEQTREQWNNMSMQLDFLQKSLENLRVS